MPATTTAATAAAVAALQALMALPNWETVATTYIGNAELLDDLLEDLKSTTWEEIAG